MKRLALVFSFFLLSGCSSWRVFEAKVPAPVVKQEVQVEAEKAAAELIARKIEKPEELKPVAVSLSASLGLPKKSLVDVRAFDLPVAAEKANDGLQAGILNMQKQLEALNVKLTKLQGKEIEGTGFSLLGPGMSAIVIGLIVLGVVFPPAFTLMGIAYRRLKSTASLVVEQIDETAKEAGNSEAIKTLKSKLNAQMDVAHKQVIHSLQKP